MYRTGRVLAPVEGKVFMRPVITREEAMSLIEAIPDTAAEVCEERNLRCLTEHYQTQIQMYDPVQLVRVIKSVRMKRELAHSRGKKLGQIDERFMHRAEEMLYGELAVALDIEKNQVVGFIAQTIG
jgi:CarD family transcriptional regulator